MAAQRVRLKDIADATGYSANTVSLALRGSPRISARTREHIKAIARKLDYTPNSIAQALVNRETRTIGLVLTDIMNPTLTLVARSIEQALSMRGYSMMLAASDNVPDKEVKALEVFRARQVDGILVYPTNHGRLDHIQTLCEAGYPMVVLTMVPSASVDVVAIDDRSGAYKAVHHLIERGHRRLLILDSAGRRGNSEKLEGVHGAIAQAGLGRDCLRVVDPQGISATDGYRTLGEEMSREGRPSAIFAITDSLAIGAMRWCLDHGLAVPGDIAIVGYDNTEAAAFCSVPMTTINYAADAVSYHAVERMMALIRAERQPATPVMTLIDPEVVIRQSS